MYQAIGLPASLHNETDVPYLSFPAAIDELNILIQAEMSFGFTTSLSTAKLIWET